MLQTTLKAIPVLLLMLGLMVESSTVNAQSRSRTSGRAEKSESSEKRAPAASKRTTPKKTTAPKKTTPQRATPKSSSSRQRSTQSTRSSGRSSSGNSTSSSTSRQRSSQATRSTGNSGSTRTRSGSTSQQANRSSGSSRSSGATRSRSGNSSNDQQASRSRANSGSNRSSGATRSRSGNTSNDQQASRSRANSGSSRSSGATRSRSGNSSNDQQATRSRAGDSNRSSSASRSRSGSGTSSRQQGASRSSSGNRSASSGRSSDARNRATTDVRRESLGRRSDNNRNASGRGTVRVDNSRTSTRRDATRVLPARNYGWRDTRKHNVYKNNKHWRYKSNRVYVNPVYHHRPNIQVNVVWPWQNRYRRQWRPTYRYCQVVYVETGYRGNYHKAKVDIRTNYHHEVRYADHRKAIVDIYIDEIEVFEDGYFLGKVRRFPKDLEHIQATIYRNGEVVYDRDVFIVGDPRAGFEMIATQSYDGYVQDYYDRSHGMDVGRLNFRRKRVDSRRYSKLFDPYDYNRYAPISVLPDDQQLLDYGYDAISYHHYDDNNDPYYGGSYDDDYYDYDNYGNHSVYNAPRGTTYGAQHNVYGKNQLVADGFVTQAQPLTLNKTNAYKTNRGVSVKIQREATLERIH